MVAPAATYLAQYNGFILPGYVQQESFTDAIRIGQHEAPFSDGSNSENLGLANKTLSLTLKVWEDDYLTVKDQIEKAATMLRSKRNGFANLYIQRDDRHYETMPETIRFEKAAGSSPRLAEYQVDFHCKPWLISDTTYTVSGNALNGATQTFSTVGRTISDGGWTYSNVLLSGSNVTVSGYTANGDFAGFISVSGTIANLTINSESFTATTGGTTNRNNYMRWSDYRMWVGPEVTYFTVTGAQKCEISYQKRWHI